MAIFSKKTKAESDENKDIKAKSPKVIARSGKTGFREKEAVVPEDVKSEKKTTPAPKKSLDHVIRHPRVTEKANDSTSQNAYVFDVDPRSNKIDISRAVEALYGVVPVKINTLKVPSKAVFNRGKKGVKSGGKKAVVYLKKGDSIEIA